ncbi:Alpha/Beta hydrolase protein [Cadophora sp. MPI-SDFR-AT-0126]|nr:Alpha/Beta hydrolase protein [Leotiomycetes sp. MPI-SDFR-AT-0126]
MAELDWNTGTKTGLVPIGTSLLHLQVSGPDRIRGEPVVLIIQGLGSCASSWAAVIRFLQPYMRVVIYDRAGLGKSEPSRLRPNLSNIVRELEELLVVTRIVPPYFIVAHSWGGVLARHFIANSALNYFSGLVLVDANHERTLQFLDWRVFMDWVKVGGINFAQALNIESRHQMLPAEWIEYQQDAVRPRHVEQSKREYDEYALSFLLLASNEFLHGEKPLLGVNPVGILVGTNGKDLTMLYNAAISQGHGTPDELKYFQKWLMKFGEIDFMLQSEATRLSTNYSVVQGPENSGHDVHVTEPAAVAELVKSTMKSAETLRRLSAGAGGPPFSHV